MDANENIQIVKDFFGAVRGGDTSRLLAFIAEDIEWIIPGKNWPLAGTHCGHAGVTELIKTESETIVMSSMELQGFVAQGERVVVLGVAEGKVVATSKAFRDNWVFAITVRNGKLASIREYVDTQALALAAKAGAPG